MIRESRGISWKTALVFFAGVLLLVSAAAPVLAKEDTSGIHLEDFQIQDFVDHFQTVDGHNVTFPALALKGDIGFSPRGRIEIRHYRGSSASSGVFGASVGDFEGRVAYLLDSPRRAHATDFPTENVHAWLSWKIWSSTDNFGASVQQERDEGLGLGISRDPSPNRAASYWYAFGTYPSVHTSLSKQVNALSFEGGGIFRIFEGFQLTLGYRYQSIIADDLPHGRAQEQGVLWGLRGNF